MVTRDADGDARELLDILFDSETEEEMQGAFADLRRLSEWNREQARKQAKDQKKPSFSAQRHRGESLEAQHDDWARFIADAKAESEASSSDGDGEGEPA